jgi:DNA-binding winged helix-turn-helix (wHTH) protein
LVGGWHAVDVQNRGRDVKNAHRQTHYVNALFDPGSHGDENPRNIIAIFEIVLGDDGGSSGMVTVSERGFYVPQRLDPVVRDDEQRRILVDVLQDHTQYFVEGPVLVRESVHCERVNLRVVAYVVGLDRVEPVAHAVLAGLREEIHKHGIRLKLQDQPFQVLALLLEHSGDVVTRDELRQKLWPGDTFVDFDTGLNSAIKKLRDVLSDSADEPRYIETLPRRGYRFIASVENGPRPASAPIELRVVPAPVPNLQKPQTPWYKRRIVVAAGIGALLVVAALAAWRIFFSRPVLTEADVILLASFVNKTGDPIFDNSLDKALEVKLTESPFLSLFSERNVHETLRMMRRDPNEWVTPELGIEICKRHFWASIFRNNSGTCGKGDFGQGGFLGKSLLVRNRVSLPRTTAFDRLSLEEPSFESPMTLVRHLQNLSELSFSTEAI